MPMKSGYLSPAVRDMVIGVFSFRMWTVKTHSANSDVRLLETLANSMSVALENARLFDETQRLLKETEQRAAELAIINSVQQALAAKLDMQGIYDTGGEKLREIFSAQADHCIYSGNLKNTDRNVRVCVSKKGKCSNGSLSRSTPCMNTCLGLNKTFVRNKDYDRNLRRNSNRLCDSARRNAASPLWMSL